VTLLLGGKGLPPAAASPDPLELLSAAAPAVSQVMHGAGVQVAGNQTIHGDLVLGSKIGTQINARRRALTPGED